MRTHEASERQRKLHNEIAGKIVESIVRPPIEAGGSSIDVLIVLESVVAGVLSVVIKVGGDAHVLEEFFDGVRQRMAHVRLDDLPPAGRA